MSRAPLRIPLGGGGTDFPGYYLNHGGYILGFSTRKYVHVVLNDTIDGKVRLKYSKNETVEDADDLDNRIAAEALKSYRLTKGIEICTFADIPESSGLGGSSSFCVALVTALRRKLELSLDKEKIFQSAWSIERVKAGQPGGIQDQMFASYGGSWSLDLSNGCLRPDFLDVSKLLPKLKLVPTHIQRPNLAIASQQIQSTELEDKTILESLNLTKILGKDIERYIKSGDLDKIGTSFHIHWENKKRRSSLISNSTLDILYKKALEGGATGGKLLGLGGGGYFLFYVPEKLEGLESIGLEVDTEGAKVVYTNGG